MGNAAHVCIRKKSSEGLQSLHGDTGHELPMSRADRQLQPLKPSSKSSTVLIKYALLIDIVEGFFGFMKHVIGFYF